ncbi:MAG: 2-C-methyl-D-erythritol 2,4-cyclodiphosphate synthase [Deferribacteraceae bacterium]|jgi:2-C-methyl-D-erythritol 2,4-cyclodiphosphate synthase|nr:2-C-methyl-D-erythritol 2,4-cyclodiphosphate synthase [Deferribacteraceae bacterium]
MTISGIGFDAHAFAEERALIIGGVHIPHHLGLLGHSDADVLAHAITDAIAGVALGKDIGNLFPDSDAKYKGADSLILLADTAALVRRAGFAIRHVDAVIIAQEPKMAPHIPAMREKLATAMGVLVNNMTIKATTTEYMGFTGRKEGIAAMAVATLEAVTNQYIG